VTTRADLVALDSQDTLAPYRARFDIPDGLIYLDGNSLGAQQIGVPGSAASVLEEWQSQLIGGWRDAGWWELPLVTGNKLGQIVGAGSGQMLVADTTTANIYKTLHAAVALVPDRSVILAEESSFPTDLYVAQSVADATGHQLQLVPRGESVGDHLDDSVAVALLNHVDFRTSQILDMSSTTAAVHDVGALAVGDLSHSAGVIPIDLDGCNADFAVGCTYKYLNGGPGAPAYLYAAERHLEYANQPLRGWLGHADPFLMTNEYEPAPGVRRFLTGTQPIVSMRVLDAALDIYSEVEIAEIRAKSTRLTGLFIELVDERCEGLGVEVISPRKDDQRGSHVSLRHADAVPVYNQLVASNIRGDFRNPDILRFGFAPLYVSHADVWDAVEVLQRILL